MRLVTLIALLASALSAPTAGAIEDGRVWIAAGRAHAGRHADELNALAALRAQVVSIARARDAAGQHFESIGSGFLAVTQCHIVTAAHVVAPEVRDPRTGRLSGSGRTVPSAVGARVKVSADFLRARARIERGGQVVAMGDLPRTLREDWAVIRLSARIDVEPLALETPSVAAEAPAATRVALRGVERVPSRAAVLAFHGDLAHRSGRLDLHAELCDRVVRGAREGEFETTCIGAPGASGAPALLLESRSKVRVAGIVTVSDRTGIDPFFGAQGVPEALRPGRLGGIRLEPVLADILAAIERSPCAER